jgi:hypothetical protein
VKRISGRGRRRRKKKKKKKKGGDVKGKKNEMRMK